MSESNSISIGLIDITANTFSKNAFCFDANIAINPKQIPLPDGMEHATFGILELKAQMASETTEHLEFVFTIDMSASMKEFCSLNKTKMDYIIHILKNIIAYMHEKTSVDFHITINGFNNDIHEIIKRTKITDENYASIVSTIDAIVPVGYTDIEKALIKCGVEVEAIQRDYPSHKIYHIFMTDGHATHGLKDVDVLKQLVVKDIMNAFIGIGLHHDADILRGLCIGDDYSRCEYHFIDKLEGAGLVYGEILYSIVYKLLTDVEINVTNGLIYDYKKNEWVQRLKIPDIVGEGCKTYNIISANVGEFSCGVIGARDDLVVLYPSHRSDSCDLSQHVIRQRVMQLFYEVNKYCFDKRNYFGRSKPSMSFHMMGKIGELMTDMNAYIEERGLDLNDDKFMKNLYNDVLVCFYGFDKKHGDIFCSARQTSQGTQRIYTVSNHSSRQDLAEEQFWCPTRETNQFLGMNDSPYLTEQATQVMNFINSTP